MPRRHLTPRMATLLGNIERARRAPLHHLSVPEARAVYESAAEVLDLPRADLPRVEDFFIQRADGHALRARLYATSNAPLPAVLFMHGGGFVVGSLETHDSLCRQIALQSGAAVVALDYRLGPEHRFPCAVDDSFAALQWLQQHADPLGLKPAPMAVAGDSAGGTLAAVCALLARDAGLPLAGQVLITPGTTAHADTESHDRYSKGFLLEAEGLAWFFDQYISTAQRTDWRFAPLMASDLDGLAPACIVLAECDPLFDEGLAYADRLRMAGVPVDLELARGVTHDFIKMGRVLPESGDAQRFIGAALRRWLGLANQSMGNA